MNVRAHPATASVRQQVSPEEWQMRVDLAACYRMVAHNGWDDLVFTHLSARVPGPEHHFLINPYGFLFEEVTASNLVKVDLAGRILLPTPHTINPAGYVIHSAIHEAREDAQCVLHLHTKSGVAVACQQQGLLPISQIALFALTSMAYHDYEGIVLDPGEKVRLVADLGEKNFLILRNHGLLTCGRSVAEAYLFMYALQTACEIQVQAQAGGGALTAVNPAVMAGMKAKSEMVLNNIGADIAWPGILRKLDRLDPSFRD